MKETIRILAAVCVLLLISATAQGQKRLNVVTTQPGLQSITEQIGGDRVKVISIAMGYQNPHFVDPKPSHILKLSRADIFVTMGLDLTAGWVPPLLNSARNAKILPGAPGYVDTSIGIELLQVPASLNRAQGDIHIYGNPHYWLNPEHGRTIARNIHDALVRLQPQNADYFTSNLERFNQALDEKIAQWQRRMRPFAGTKIIAYHNQWPYFEEAFGLSIVEFLEPRPGLPPTPSQLAKVILLMEQEGIEIIIIAPYYKPDAAELVARKVGGRVVTLASEVGAFAGVNTYFDLFDYNVDRMLEALQAGTN